VVVGPEPGKCQEPERLRPSSGNKKRPGNAGGGPWVKENPAGAGGGHVVSKPRRRGVVYANRRTVKYLAVCNVQTKVGHNATQNGHAPPVRNVVVSV